MAPQLHPLHLVHSLLFVRSAYDLRVVALGGECGVFKKEEWDKTVVLVLSAIQGDGDFLKMALHHQEQHLRHQPLRIALMQRLPAINASNEGETLSVMNT